MKRHTAVGQSARQRGFSLIEALIAVVVLATGLLALTALQGALIRNSADAKARSQLAAFAESELDARRIGGFGGAGLAVGTPAAVTATPTDNTPLGRAAKAMGASSVTESITVRQFVANTAGAFPATGCTTSACVTTAVAGRSTVAQYKQVDLTLTWTDATGATNRKLAMSTAFSPLALSPSDVLVDRPPPDNSNLRPIVRRPSPVTEGMIPIALGDGQDTAATNPKPELVGRTDDTLVSDTRFEVLTYDPTSNLGVSGFVQFNKRIETAMVGCTCQTGLTGFPTGGSSPGINTLLRAKAFRPSYWEGTSYTEPEPVVDAPDTSPDDTVTQSQLCDVCCRDHKDPSTEPAPKYNPWLATGTEHEHFLTPTGTAVTNGNFKEACRVIRVNGVWRVTPNPRTDDIALLATREYPHTTGSDVAPADNNRATRPEVSTDGKDSYIAYAYDFIKQVFFDESTSYDRDAGQTAAGLNNPDYVPIKSGDVRWLHARGILVDFLEVDAVEAIQDAIDDCAAGASPTVKAQCVLPYLPITTLNVTELAAWSGKETSETGIVHTGPLALVTTLKNYGQALLNRFVSALALVAPVNPSDDDNPIKDEQTFALVPPATKTGTWLSVASPSSVIFGDPADPKRGFASLASPIHFDATLDGVPHAHDTDPGNDPAVRVLSVTQPCKHGPENEYGTDHDTYKESFACPTDTTTSVVLAFGEGLNFLKRTGLTGPNVASICGVGTPTPGKQAKCVYYSLTRGIVDGIASSPAALNYRVESGTLTRPSEVSSVTIPSVSSTTPVSSVTLEFTTGEFNATQTCNVSVWTCN